LFVSSVFIIHFNFILNILDVSLQKIQQKLISTKQTPSKDQEKHSQSRDSSSKSSSRVSSLYIRLPFSLPSFISLKLPPNWIGITRIINPVPYFFSGVSQDVGDKASTIKKNSTLKPGRNKYSRFVTYDQRYECIC
jgi:hypothetical protein